MVSGTDSRGAKFVALSAAPADNSAFYPPASEVPTLSMVVEESDASAAYDALVTNELSTRDVMNVVTSSMVLLHNSDDNSACYYYLMQPVAQTPEADVEQASDEQQTSSHERKGRKRERNVAEWKQNVRKRLRSNGMQYTRSDGQVCERRRMAYHRCGQCVNKCKDRVSEEARYNIFQSFWAMSDHSRQRDYICSHVQRKKPSKGRTKTTFVYYLTVEQERIRVCKQVFLATLNIGERTVRYAVEHSIGTGKSQEDRMGKHSPGRKKTDVEKKRVCDHIASFPALDSHYAIADTRKKYLEATLSVRKVYYLYKED